MLFKSFFESQIAFNPSMLLRFFPFKYNLVGYQVYCRYLHFHGQLQSSGYFLANFEVSFCLTC